MTDREDKISALAELLLQDVVSGRISADAVYELTRTLAETVTWPQNVSLDRLGQYLHALWRSGELEGMPWEFSFHAGRLLSLIDLLKMSAELKADEEQLQTDARRYLNRHPIFRAVAEEPGICHGDLAKKVNLSDSTLSQFMNRIENRNYIGYRKSGRTKYYFLQENGKALLEKMEELLKK